MEPANATIRVDKWLWYARFFKTRGLATRLVQSGKLRVNAVAITKPSRAIGPGDVLTFPKEQDIRVIKVLGLGHRRGPAPEAQALYQDMDPPKPKPRDMAAPRTDSRPTGRDRRAFDKLQRDLASRSE